MHLSLYRENFAYLLVFSSINPKPISEVHKGEKKGMVCKQYPG